MLTVKTLLAVLEGLDHDAQVVVGIIDGSRYNAAYAEHQVCAKAVELGPDRQDLLSVDAPALYIGCYAEPRPWEGPEPTLSEDGTASLEYDPNDASPKSGNGDEPMAGK